MTDNPIQTLKALRDAAKVYFTSDNLEAIDQAIKLLEQYEKRLEIDPRHNYDGIDARDETIRGLEKKLEARQVDVEND
jgi:hypothetical protein